MRNVGIALVSILLTTVVIGNAFYQKKQFYPSVVYITKSNPSMAVIYIQAFILVILAGKLMRKVFFGELRPVELEHLMERSWYAVTETCLAFTVFRDDFSPKFVALFTLLLFLKSFHWLADERVDFMERSPVISWLFHVRIISLLIMLGALDITFVSHAYQSTLNRGASVQLVFGFEYAILLTIILNIVIKYAFHVNDIHDLPMENKAVFLLYTELVMGFIKVMLYLSFVFIMVRIYTLPLFAFRPMYFTVKAFKKAINDVIMSRRAIRNMNTLYPDATPEELEAADNVCIICREEMHSASKKLPCNHIFHTSCLRSWFQRQQTCPTCRLNILRTPNTQTAPGQPQNARQEPQVHVPPLQGNFQWMPNPNPNVVPGNNNNDRARPPPGPSGSVPQQQPGPMPDNIPLICPPFPFIAFNVPPPMPPTETLTDEELRKMELQTREGTEARIRCLQNIRCLLDASVTMMQQYCAVVAASQINQQNVFETNNQSTSGETAAGSSSTDAVPDPAQPSTSTPAPQNTEDSSQNEIVEGTNEDNAKVEEDSKTQPAGVVENEVLRQRRLEKFTKELNNTNPSSQ